MRLERTASVGIVLLIFFFNSFLLPGNIQLIFLTVPFIVYMMHKRGELNKLFLPFVIVTLFSLIHLILGVVLKDFLISTAVVLFLIVFLYGFFHFYRNFTGLDDVFRMLTYFNAIFTFLALLSFFSGVLVSVFWYLVPFTAGYEALPRLKLFHLEASHYSFALLPLFFYYFWKTLKEWGLKNILLLASLTLSLILSFSLGVLAVIGIAIFLVFILKFRSLMKEVNTRKSILIAGSFIVLIAVFLFVVFPDNPLLFRIQNLFQGNDTSGRGRTYEALEIGWLILDNNNYVFGIGFGQFKIIGRDILLNYYRFMSTPDVARLPNGIAETMVATGVLGVAIKLYVQCYFFFKQRVFGNIFQLSMFIALFVYQFTGSYLFNAMEYVFWIMVFYPRNKSFNQSTYFAT